MRQVNYNPTTNRDLAEVSYGYTSATVISFKQKYRNVTQI